MSLLNTCCTVSNDTNFDKFCALLTGAMYGGGSDLFYSQFDLHTRDQKRSQIILLEVNDPRIQSKFIWINLWSMLFRIVRKYFLKSVKKENSVN